MKISSKEIATYGAIAIIVLVATWVYASNYASPQSGYSVAVTLKQLNASTQYFPDQTSYFAIFANNTGGSTITNMTLVMYINNVQKHTYSVTLPPGTTGEINTSYTYPTNGVYAFSAVADPAGLLNIKDRPAAASTLTVNVSAPQTPDVYTAIPNNNTLSTQSFTLFQSGIDATLFFVTHYNIPYFNDMLGGGSQPLISVFEDLSQYISGMNGAFSVYSNSSYAYTVWLQGAATPSVIDQVVSSFRYPQTTTNFGGRQLTYYRVSNQTSLCVFYYGGWTKIIEYGNSSHPATCYTMVPKNFTPSMSNTLVAEIKQHPNINQYQQNFHYTNSSLIGLSLVYVDGNITALNVFNTSLGFFSGVVADHSPPLKLASLNSTCIGVSYSSNNVNVCSAYIFPKGGGFGASYALLNSSEVTPEYTATLYSLVNNTFVLSAHNHAVSLLGYLGLNGTTLRWNSPYKNLCKFANASIGCYVLNYTFANQSLTVNMTNNLQSSITVNKIACYLGGQIINVTVGSQIAPGSTAKVHTFCTEVSLPGGFSFQTSFQLILNYTVGGKVKYASGLVNVTSYAT